MNNRRAVNKGFTLVELLVVISIIGLLSSVAVVSLNSSRGKARDAKRIADMRQLQTALNLYYEVNGSFISSLGWQNDCDGYTGFASALSPLVSGGFISKIPSDPSSPRNPWPQCYYYQSANTCAGTDTVTHPYILVFTTESTQLSLNSWSGEANRWCLYPTNI